MSTCVHGSEIYEGEREATPRPYPGLDGFEGAATTRDFWSRDRDY